MFIRLQYILGGSEKGDLRGVSIIPPLQHDVVADSVELGEIKTRHIPVSFLKLFLFDKI